MRTWSCLHGTAAAPPRDQRPRPASRARTIACARSPVPLGGGAKSSCTEAGGLCDVTSPDPTAPGELLPDVWFTRDLPVLRAIARLVDEPKHGGAPYLLGSVVPASGLPKADVIAAAKALASAGYIEALTNHAGDIVRITAISGEARRLAGLWPTPPGEGERLFQQLTARAANAATDVERARWQAFADAATAIGPDHGALLMSALIGGYVPRAR